MICMKVEGRPIMKALALECSIQRPFSRNMLWI